MTGRRQGCGFPPLCSIVLEVVPCTRKKVGVCEEKGMKIGKESVKFSSCTTLFMEKVLRNPPKKPAKTNT